MMDIKNKQKQLSQIYRAFEEKMLTYKEGAFCKAGCSFCCTHFGHVDITTLEGLIIIRHIQEFPKKLLKNLRKKIDANKKEKENSQVSPCPFLKSDQTCLVYDVRPFSCRRLYSVKKCDNKGPTVHYHAESISGETVTLLQKLDSTGYSGHLTFILHLLQQPAFMDLYLSGGFDPSQIAAFGKSHGMIINCSKY